MKNILERMDDQKEEQKDLREMFRAFMDKSEKHEEAKEAAPLIVEGTKMVLKLM